MRNKLIVLSLLSGLAGCALFILAPSWNVDPHLVCICIAAAIVAVSTPKNAKS